MQAIILAFLMATAGAAQDKSKTPVADPVGAATAQAVGLAERGRCALRHELE